MNKQEALEALLAKCRGWEQAGAEVPRAAPERVLQEMNEAMDRLVITREAADQQAQLTIIGAAALYLLRDEVQVVVPDARVMPMENF